MINDTEDMNVKMKKLEQQNQEIMLLLADSKKLFQILSVKNGPMKHEAYQMCQRIINFEDNNQ